METFKVKAYGTEAADAPFQNIEIKRRNLLPDDVEIDILYCGICHSDLHAVKNDWGGTIYPIVPGHEIVGRITQVGTEVTKFKVGDLAAIGCIVDSCGHCHQCDNGEEQFCEKGWTVVFNAPDKVLGGQTYGGFSEKIVAKANYVLKMPENIDLAVRTAVHLFVHLRFEQLCNKLIWKVEKKRINSGVYAPLVKILTLLVSHACKLNSRDL